MPTMSRWSIMPKIDPYRFVVHVSPAGEKAADLMVEAQQAVAMFHVGDDDCPSRAVAQAMNELEAAFVDDEFDRAEHLAAVVMRMVRRDLPKFQANPKAWLAKLRGGGA